MVLHGQKKWFNGNKKSKKKKSPFDHEVCKERFWIKLNIFIKMQTRGYENIVCCHKIILFCCLLGGNIKGFSKLWLRS